MAPAAPRADWSAPAPTRIAVQKGERLEDNRHRRAQAHACGREAVPGFTRAFVQRVSRQRQGYPGAGVDEHELGLPHSVIRSGLVVDVVVVDRRPRDGAVPQSDGASASGRSQTRRTASRTSAATLRPDRAATACSASSSSWRRYT